MSAGHFVEGNTPIKPEDRQAKLLHTPFQLRNQGSDMSKIFSVLITAQILVAASSAEAACQAPAPIPPPEPQCVVPDDNRETGSLRPLKATRVSTTVPQQDDSLAAPATQGSIEESQSATPRPLPDIVKCCPLSAITLSKAIAKVSRKDEALPVPSNEAGDYLQSHGIQIAERVVGTSSLRHPEPVFFEHLYFEDPNLERCGAGHGIATELVSAVRFFGRAPLVPYMVGSIDKHQCVQSLGDCPVCYRYGKSAYLPALNARGVAFEAAAVVGLVFLLP